jgi:L-asparagine oxygenase
MSVVMDTGLPAIVHVGPDDGDAVGEVAGDLARAGPGAVDDPRWITAAGQAWETLPARVRRSVRSFRRNSGGSGVLLLRGLPVGGSALPPTPTVSGSVQRAPSISSAVLMMIASGLGDPAAYRPEKSGALVQDVVPVPGQEEIQGNSGSIVLTFHNENAFHPHRPDFLALLCLRADHDNAAGLRTACVRRALPELSGRTRRALREPSFVTLAPPSFGSAAGGADRHAILSGAADDPDVRVDLAATTALTRDAADALTDIGTAFELVATTHTLQPGDLAVVDNRVTVHGRTAFRPRYDGRDRWLQRTFVLSDLRRSREYRSADGNLLVR